jgi:CheY-like chemotaxis protein
LLEESVTRPFRHEAERRGLSFDVTISPELRSITTDSKRLQQVLKNLLSNAIKFTEYGGVRMRVASATSGWTPTHPVLATASTVVAFEVTDTGIGILPEKQRIIFEAFQQADASTNRRYGGTGLGLAISRELANLLGGEIHLRSRAGEGSTFTLYLPQSYVGPARVTAKGASGTRSEVRADGGPVHRTEETLPQPTDDRAHLGPDDAALLIVEDDPHYSRILVDLARDIGLKALVASRGVDALALAREFSPLAISLDVFLPDMLGWAVLSQLKQDPRTRHIPVQIVTLDEDRQHGLAGGAFAFVNKPTTMDKLKASISRLTEYARDSRKRLLVVEDNPAELMGITELLGYQDIEVVTAGNGREALAMLREQPTDCIVLDLKLPDMSGFELLEHIRQDDALTHIPVVVFTGRELSLEEDAQLHSIARSVIVKGVESPERLLDETALFLHRVVANLPPDKQRMLDQLRNSDENLHGRKALLVDDDARNIFALSSVLERRGMDVLTATTGREAISILKADRGISIVLMDIMMPEMDGYETIQAIRADPSVRRLPIIALTAKAMKGDRERCLEAGASDYLAKPVNTEQLLSALRIWLHR